MGWVRRLLSIAGTTTVVAASLATVSAAPVDAEGVTNGGLGWSNDRFTATQRIDRLDGTADELPAAVGPDALFNETGDAILSYRGGTMYVLRANGVVEGLGKSAPSALHGYIAGWTDDESYSVVTAFGQNVHTYRVSPGKPKVELPEYFGGGIMRSSDGVMAFTQYSDDFSHFALHTADPLHPDVDPVTVSPTWCSSLCDPEEPQLDWMEPVSWDAGGDRLLVDYSAEGAAGLGWYTPGDGAVQPIGASLKNAAEIFLSPDNTEVAFNRGSGKDESTKVVDLSNGQLVTEIPGHHWGWQPCIGTCAMFDDPVSPSKVPIGEASSGRKGGKATATVRWEAPAKAGTSPVDHYMLEATPVGAPAGRGKQYTDRGKGERSYAWKLAKGRWKFRVCAYNTASPYCTISKYSNTVRAR